MTNLLVRQLYFDIISLFLLYVKENGKTERADIRQKDSEGAGGGELGYPLAFNYDVRYYVHMNKNTISISQARSKLFAIAQKVQTPGVYFTFTDKGRPKTVIMSADEYESMVETLEVMHDFPDLDKTIAKVDKDIKSGAYLRYPTLDDILTKEGYILNNKAKTKHVISTTHRAKRAKKS